MDETQTPDFADLTLDELRLALAPAIADAAIFDGWSNAALEMAADQMGADIDVDMDFEVESQCISLIAVDLAASANAGGVQET